MDWTASILKKYVNKVLKTFGKGIDYRFEAIKQAIEKSDGYAEYRDAKQNEFQGTIEDMNKTFARKRELENLEKQFNIWMSGARQVQEANFNVNSDSIRDLTKKIDKIEARKEGGNIVWVYIVSTVSMLAAIISITITLLK